MHGQRKGEEKDRAPDKFKNKKFALGKAPESLPNRQEASLGFFTKTDKKLYKAYQLKKYLQTLIRLLLEGIEVFLRIGCGRHHIHRSS